MYSVYLYTPNMFKYYKNIGEHYYGKDFLPSDCQGHLKVVTKDF